MDFYLQRALDAIESATSGMNAEQLSWSRDGKWSAAEVLEHLSLAYRSTTKLMDRCLQQGHADRRKASVKQWVATLLVVRIGYFPSGRTAPEWTRPRGIDPATAVDQVREALIAMDLKIGKTQAKFGGGVLALHPIIGPLTAQQWRKFHWEHTRHHMKQVCALRAALPSHRAASA
jgi:hypothetical protein